jgi:hypothetical protein
LRARSRSRSSSPSRAVLPPRSRGSSAPADA